MNYGTKNKRGNDTRCQECYCIIDAAASVAGAATIAWYNLLVIMDGATSDLPRTMVEEVRPPVLSALREMIGTICD